MFFHTLVPEAVVSDSVPEGLGVGGRSLWVSVTADHSLDAVQRVTLLEACRSKDRLDKLDEVLRGDAETWMSLTHRVLTEDYELKIDDALGKANQTANLLKQLLAALRLPDDVAGKRPQQRGGARGAYAPAAAGGGRVTAIERARKRSEGA
jgi:hypothetical protein